MGMMRVGPTGFYESALPPIQFETGGPTQTNRPLAIAPSTGNVNLIPEGWGPDTNTMTRANPYIPGRQYSNLIYLGGDPYDERNWQPVQ